jgi:para-nitrobenzyl esterase
MEVPSGKQRRAIVNRVDLSGTGPRRTFVIFSLEIVGAFFCALVLAGCGGAAGPSALAITTSSLPDGTIGTSYSQEVQISGGTPPYTWTVTSGTLPDNLMLQTASQVAVSISGVPDMVQSGVQFSISVKDARGQTASQSYTVNIKSTPTVVQTKYGALRGVEASNLIAFRGIPYTTPPVGNLRWKAPQPPASWKGVRDASKFGNVCPQINFSGQLVGDEDCLTLNVFVSQTPPSQQQPVMVFLHGGGNSRGDAQSSSFDAPPLASQGVVVVTLEYRVGILGFLVTPELTAEGGGSSGDYALRDMVAALTWVQQNIAAFGGDPQHVLLFGQSAGSFDIQFLLAAPAAQGLFSAAGMISGAVPLASNTTWLLSFSAAQTGSAPFVTAMGCSAAADVLACLRGVPATTIVNYRGPLGFPAYGFGSTFLPVDSVAYLQQHGSPVPLLIGSTSEEYTLVRDDPAVLGTVDLAGYTTAIHQRFDPVGAGVADQVLSLYPAASYDTPFWALVAADSDYQITCETRGTARATAGANRQPVWRYIYTHRFENDFSLNGLRAGHTTDLYFIFGNFNLVVAIPNYMPTPAEMTFSQTLMGYWTRFAATGNPNGAGAVAWPQYDANTEGMLQLDDTFVAINGYHVPQCTYLETLTQP